MRSTAVISRREVMQYARGFFPQQIRSRVKVDVAGKHHVITAAGRIVGQGDSWETAYMNMRANLPTADNGATDWKLIDARAEQAKAVAS